MDRWLRRGGIEVATALARIRAVVPEGVDVRDLPAEGTVEELSAELVAPEHCPARAVQLRGPEVERMATALESPGRVLYDNGQRVAVCECGALAAYPSDGPSGWACANGHPCAEPGASGPHLAPREVIGRAAMGSISDAEASGAPSGEHEVAIPSRPTHAGPEASCGLCHPAGSAEGPPPAVGASCSLREVEVGSVAMAEASGREADREEAAPLRYRYVPGGGPSVAPGEAYVTCWNTGCQGSEESFWATVAASAATSGSVIAEVRANSPRGTRSSPRTADRSSAATRPRSAAPCGPKTRPD